MKEQMPTPEIISGSDFQALAALKAELSKANNVAVDTETATVYTPQTLPPETLVNGTAVGEGADRKDYVYDEAAGTARKRDLLVDGPGKWRVMSIAARYGRIDQNPTYKTWVIDIEDSDPGTWPTFLEGVKPCGWNASFDRSVLRRGGLDVTYWWDGMLINATLNAGMNGSDSARYESLAKVARRELGVVMEGKDSTRLSYDEQSPLTDEQVRYAAADAWYTLLVCDILFERVRSRNLVNTVSISMKADPFINSMELSGLPLDKQAYLTEVVNPAKEYTAKAAQTLAVLTTGKEMLKTVTGWAKKEGLADDTVDEVEFGLSVFADRVLFDRFLQSVFEASETLAVRLGNPAGFAQSEEKPLDGLFGQVGPEPVVDITDENAVRRWLTKSSPTLAQAVVVSDKEGLSVEETVAELTANTEEFCAKSGKSKRLLKAHSFETQVLPLMIAGSEAGLPGFDSWMGRWAADFAAWRRYQRILETYAYTDLPTLVPDWNPGSADDAKAMLNRFDTARVESYFLKTEGKARLLEKADTVVGNALKLIGGELAEALLEWRKYSKRITTYGEDFLADVHPATGRLHSRYNRELTGTGRLSSYKPNAQNLLPQAKPFLRPTFDDTTRRVLVCGDLSQAELRLAAGMSQDQAMITAFASGVDLHAYTASLMFSVDLDKLKDFDGTVQDVSGDLAAACDNGGLSRLKSTYGQQNAAYVYKTLRQKAKSVAFGYAYGIGPAKLAENLTVNGVDTTVDEAKELLELFNSTYTSLATYMGERKNTVMRSAEQIRKTGADVSWAKTWELYWAWSKVKKATADLTARNSYMPSVEEIAEELVGSTDPTLLSRAVDRVRWVMGFEHPMVVDQTGTPYVAFTSYTSAGRQRQFPVLTKNWIWSMIQLTVKKGTRTAAGRALEDWVNQQNEKARLEVEGTKKKAKEIRVRERGKALWGKPLEKQLPVGEVRESLIKYIVDSLQNSSDGWELENLYRDGLADYVRSLGNQYRNHPIQGGVADAMLIAMDNIYKELLQSYPSAMAVQSVHDSIVIECDIEQAASIREMVKTHMESGLAQFCEGVVVRADVDVQYSLDGSDLVEDSML